MPIMISWLMPKGNTVSGWAPGSGSGAGRGGSGSLSVKPMMPVELQRSAMRLAVRRQSPTWWEWMTPVTCGRSICLPSKSGKQSWYWPPFLGFL